MQEFQHGKGGTRQSPLVTLPCCVDFSVEESSAGCTGIAADPSVPELHHRAAGQR
jgi:hypothetical protein